MTKLLKSLFVLYVLLPYTTLAQVKIGDTTGGINPIAILELKDTARGFLLPQMNLAQMGAIVSPTDGLLVYNNTLKSIYQYNQTESKWKPIMADSSEWFYHPSSAKLYLRRALNNQDSFYYNTSTKKFMYADTRYYRFGFGTSSFNLDEGNSDRFIFKTTASRFLRPAENLNSANIYSVYEVDYDSAAYNNPFFANYYGMAVDATVIPQATQKIGFITGIRSTASFAGSDSLSVVYGTQSTVNLRGKGYTELAYGINNSVNIRDSSLTIGFVYGIQNNISYSSPLGTPRIIGNVYGYFSSMSTALNGKVDGNAYGIFLNNVNATGIGSVRNWGIYTNKGPIRFGDSVAVTEGTAQRPRAVFDVNSTTAMIMPAGTTVQRPVTLYPGMLRYNADNATPEAYTTTGWVNLKNPVIASTALLDPPLIANNTTGTVNYTFTSASVGNTVTISPAAALPNGIVIAWANVSAPNQITVGFANFSGAGVDLPVQNFYIKVVQ